MIVVVVCIKATLLLGTDGVKALLNSSLVAKNECYAFRGTSRLFARLMLESEPVTL
jgi:hypothetical protein